MDIVLEELSSNILRKLSKEEEIEILKKYKIYIKKAHA